jgi:hypothetical protein
MAGRELDQVAVRFLNEVVDMAVTQPDHEGEPRTRPRSAQTSVNSVAMSSRSQMAILHMDWIHPILIRALLLAFVYLQRGKILRITRQSSG